jgi:hypothetical protein
MLLTRKNNVLTAKQKPYSITVAQGYKTNIYDKVYLNTMGVPTDVLQGGNNATQNAS